MHVYTARWLLPVTSAPLSDGAVAIDAAGRIAYVGPAAGAPPGDVHHVGDAVLLPGLVAVQLPPSPTPVALAGVTALATTVAGGADVAALLASGVRGVAYHAVIGPAPADRAPAIAALRTAVARTRAAIADAGATGRVRPGVAPGPMHAIGEDLLLDACAWAVAEDLPLAIPAGASAAEVAFVREAAGPHADRLRAAGLDVVRRAHSTVHLLAELGIAAVARPLLTGAACFDESDVALAAYYDCPVAYVPLGTPPAPGPLPALRAAGARAALNTAADLLAVAAQVTPTPADAVHLVTLGAARALGLATDIGSLDVGKHADLCAFALDGAGLRAAKTVGPEHALVSRPTRAAIATIVGGRPLRAAPPERSRPV